MTVLDDGSVLAAGEAPETDRYTIVAPTDLRGVTALRLEALPHESFKNNGPGRAPDNGNFVLSEIRVLAVSREDPSVARPVALRNATQDFTQDGFSAALAADGKSDDRKGWAIGGAFGSEHAAIFETAEDVGFEGGSLLTISLDQQFGGRHTIGRFRLSLSRSPRPVRESQLAKNVVAALLTPPEERTADDRAAIYRAYLANDAEMQQQIRLGAAQDITWALINSPAFLFNR